MLAQRSQEKELIDLGPDFYTRDEYQQCMQKMFSVNRMLGFFRRTKKLLAKVIPHASVLDIGCGNGSFILKLSQYFPHMQFMGVDIARDAIELANQQLQTKNSHNVFFKQEEKNFTQSPNSVDVILATLLCHHLYNAELIEFLRQAYRAAKKMVVVHDLHRHPVAHFFYRLMSPIIFRNRLITHDGLISIRRSFTRREWIEILTKADIKDYQIKWHFPFCWSVILWKK